MNYSERELQVIISRHLEADRGMRVIGLGLAALSGAFVVGLAWYLS